MKSKWLKKFEHRVKKTLHKFKKKDVDNFDEPHQEYKLVSLTLINLGGKKRKGIKAPPVHGNALYYVYDYGDEVKLLHPHYLKTHVVGRRTFDKGVTDVWWPNEDAVKNPEVKNRYGIFCNRFKVADTMLMKLKEQASREITSITKKTQRIIREAIADLKGIDLDKVPKYKLPEKVDGLKIWRENMAKAGYKKRITKDLKKYEKVKEEKEKKMSKKSKKSKKEKTEPKEKGGVKIPTAKSTKAVLIRHLHGHKGKTCSLQSLQEAVQKSKKAKKEYPEKKVLAKAKVITTWAKKNGFSFKSSSKGFKLS